MTQTALFDDKGQPAGPVFKSVQLNFDRIRGAEGRPLEALDSIRSLNDTLETYGQVITEYERTRFRFLIAIGLPARDILSLFPPVPTVPGSSDPKLNPKRLSASTVELKHGVALLLSLTTSATSLLGLTPTRRSRILHSQTSLY